MAEQPDLDGLQREARSFRAARQTLLLATSAPDGVPDASYAPFILDDAENPCIFISRLARHTQNLLANPRVSVMLIEDESTARNLFGRKRLTFDCNAVEIPRDSEQGNELLDRFEARFGKTIALLRTLGDFHLFRLEVISGGYVRGFGQAWDLADASLNIAQQKRG